MKTLSVTEFRRMHTRAGTGSKFNTTVRKKVNKQRAKTVERVVFELPDPRERNYPEDLEGLTEGERKLMKPKSK